MGWTEAVKEGKEFNLPPGAVFKIIAAYRDVPQPKTPPPEGHHWEWTEEQGLWDAVPDNDTEAMIDNLYKPHD
jgi:hypothetical protein